MQVDYLVTDGRWKLIISWPLLCASQEAGIIHTNTSRWRTNACFWSLRKLGFGAPSISGVGKRPIWRPLIPHFWFLRDLDQGPDERRRMVVMVITEEEGDKCRNVLRTAGWLVAWGARRCMMVFWLPAPSAAPPIHPAHLLPKDLKWTFWQIQSWKVKNKNKKQKTNHYVLISSIQLISSLKI